MNSFLILTAIASMTAPATLDQPSPTTTQSAAAAAASQPEATDKRRYCVVNTNTGSRIPVKQCRTRSEWTRLGIDVLAQSN